jgi:hypothetical protein
VRGVLLLSRRRAIAVAEAVTPYAEEECPLLPGPAARSHGSLPAPAAIAGPERSARASRGTGVSSRAGRASGS